MSVSARVLVTGGHGFLGANLVRGLCQAGYAVRTLDRRREPALPLPEGVEHILGDFCHRATVDLALEGMDCVFHLASATTPQSGTDDPVHDVNQNLVGTLHLLESCVSRRVPRVVFSSSGGTVYGRPRNAPIPEDSPTDPLNSYGVVKLAIEKYLGMYRALGRLQAIVLRASNPYGPGQDPQGTQGAVAVALGALRWSRPFHLWGDGAVVRDFLYVDDLTRAFLLALKAPAEGPWIFNVGSGQGTSLLEVLHACEQASGRPMQVERFPGRPIDVPVNVLDVRLARQHLGWVPEVRLTEGLSRTWAWLQQVPLRP
jgi:UDP-glucose 4-epimerase